MSTDMLLAPEPDAHVVSDVHVFRSSVHGSISMAGESPPLGGARSHPPRKGCNLGVSERRRDGDDAGRQRIAADSRQSPAQSFIWQRDYDGEPMFGWIPPRSKPTRRVNGRALL